MQMFQKARNDLPAPLEQCSATAAWKSQMIMIPQRVGEMSNHPSGGIIRRNGPEQWLSYID